MKSFAIAALLTAQLLGAAPARAADLADEGFVSQQRGTFAGARVRVPFGGEESGKLRAGLSLTSMQRVDIAGGGSRTRFAPGAELSLSSAARPELRLGGAPLSQRLAAAQSESERKKGGGVGKTVLKGGAILLIVGAVVVGGLVLALAAHCGTTSQCED